MTKRPDSAQQELDHEREGLLQQIHARLEIPMLMLAFVWLALFVIEVLWGVSPLLQDLGYAIWALFLIEFLIGFVLAPRKLRYLRHNWLKAIALAAPALRLFRVVALARLARTVRVARGLRLLRLVSSINRGMNALGASLGRRGFGYVVVLTVIVLMVGAAGIYTFERDASQPAAIDSYATALWWTAMVLTTMGSEYWPKSAEGRLLCLFLAVYAFTVFGYVTATLATYFIGRDAANADAEVAGQHALDDLRSELAGLREEMRANHRELTQRQSLGAAGEHE